MQKNSKLNQKKTWGPAPSHPPPPGNVQVQAEIKFLEQYGFGLEPWESYEKVRKKHVINFLSSFICFGPNNWSTDYANIMPIHIFLWNGEIEKAGDWQ